MAGAAALVAESRAEQLTLGVEVVGSCAGGSFKYYCLELADTSRMLLITAEPVDNLTDPDIFVANTVRKVTQEDYQWKSSSIGADSLEIHPSDPAFVPGVYSVGVYGYRPGVNKFRIKAEFINAGVVVDLKETFSHTVESWDVFKFPISHPGDSRLEISVESGPARLALFVSPFVFYPNVKSHHWSVGHYDESILARLPEATYSAFEDERYEELDILDRAMLRHAVIPPTERELQAYESLAASSPPIAPCDSLTLCIDTDDWRYTPQVCHLSVMNYGSEPVSYRITRREVLQSALLPPEYVSRFQAFQSAFEMVAGSEVSQAERDRLHIRDQSEFTYGEVEFVGLIPLLQLCDPQQGWVFWDLGCGAGKCLAAVALLCPQFASVNGVELLPALCVLGKEAVKSLRPPTPMARINIVEGDLLAVDWSGADLVYMASICFPDELLEAVVEKAKGLKVGAKILTLKPFPPTSEFEIQAKVRVRMTWGKSAVFLLQKVK